MRHLFMTEREREREREKERKKFGQNQVAVLD